MLYTPTHTHTHAFIPLSGIFFWIESNIELDVIFQLSNSTWQMHRMEQGTARVRPVRLQACFQDFY